MEFQTGFRYFDRKTKARYVFEKYGQILKGEILDVGADACHLREHLGKGVKYTGIGFGEMVDREVDLEIEGIPYSDRSFDCVLCLDVLEHLENIHEFFDELCRVTRKWLIVSLPNPYNTFMSYLREGDYSDGQHMKFYGLPPEKPKERHKWFFAPDEAERFVRLRAEKNGMAVVQFDSEESGKGGPGLRKAVAGLLDKNLSRIVSDPLLHKGTMWAVLEKPGGQLQQHGNK